MKGKVLDSGIVAAPLPVEKTDAEKRVEIPSRADLKTQYHPMNDLMMIVPLPEIKTVGGIILPDRAQITLNEGHIVELGPKSGDQFGVGDCVTWDQQSEYRLDVDGVKFILVRPSAIIMRIPHAELVKQQPKKK